MDPENEIQLTENATIVLQRRYLQKDAQGKVIESPGEMFRRVADFIARADGNYGADDSQIEETAEGFFGMMAALEFLPNSPTLMNAGRELGQLSACFVLPIGDSMEEIFEANKHAALIHKSGGGTGFSFSRLRPRNSVVASTSGVASGPVSFMKVIDASTEAVKQGGTRRGANMGVLRVDHPDILEFIACKDDPDEITNFNISVGITDTYMEALMAGLDYPLYNPHTGRTHERDGKPVCLNAGEVWERLVDHAWQTGEPGVIFLDRMNKHNPTSPSETIEATNPCGEQPLPPYDSCNLGSINLGKFVKEPLPQSYEPSEPASGVDWDQLANTIRKAVHFLDNVIDQNRYPIPQIEEQTRRNRRIGLGVMGWADMLVKLQLPYNCHEASEFGEQMMAFIQTEAKNQSSDMVRSRGRFPNWEGSTYCQVGIAMRNATVTTVAPTGSISIIAGCSSGIEPYYALALERRVMDGTRLVEINPLFEKISRDGGFYSEDLVREVSTCRSIARLSQVPEQARALFMTADDVSPEEHVRMQAAFQKNCDSSVSKTINLPRKASRKVVQSAFELAYETGCKGVTVYRDESRPDQVLSLAQAGSPLDEGKRPGVKQIETVAERPGILKGITEKIKTGYGNLYVTVNVKNDQPFEVFAQIGKSGYTTMADTEAICRLISLALRSSIPIDRIIRQLRGIGGSVQAFSKGGRVFSIPDAIAQVLNRHFGVPDPGDPQSSGSPSGYAGMIDICPECAAPMQFDAGCYLCRSCGYSSC
jgi:ribonucleoside-diphosphate reductase alpha chain